jgi:Tfp pilus assembly protein PilF
MQRVFALFIAIVTCATVVRGTVPIIIQTGAHQRAVMKLCSDASDQLRNGDIAGAKRNVDAALHIDPKLWPALYVRAQILERRANTNSPFRIAMKRSGNIQAASRLPCCAPTSPYALANTRTR